jgi:lysophospholipase L1-like esterase
VRLELVGDAEAVEISYRTETEDFGYRGEGAGTTFGLWRDGALVAEEKAVLGEGAVRLATGPAHGRTGSGERAIVYLPEGMKPTVLSIEGVGGSIEPAPPQRRWVAYGDSIAEGWVASGPSGAWPAIAGRTHRLDVCNMGYAGSARGEIVSAEHVAALEADVISITHGTNCWTRIPFSVDMMRAGTAAFVDVVRQGHPETPIVVASPVVRPDAEATPNRLGATLADLRAVMEAVAQARIEAGDKRLTLVPGRDIIGPELLADGIHPGDEGHRVLAEVVGGAVRDALDRS